MLPVPSKVFCPKINLRYFQCLHRGHAEGDRVCSNSDVNLTIFEEAAAMGFVTKHRFRPERGGSGYYPVLTLAQVRHVDNMGGYYRLLALDAKEAEDLTNEGARLHTQWLGAKPCFTQAAASRGFKVAVDDTENALIVGHQVQAGRHRQRRIRPMVNFRQRLCPLEDNLTAWGDKVD
jgi:hypothetical protein